MITSNYPLPLHIHREIPMDFESLSLSLFLWDMHTAKLWLASSQVEKDISQCYSYYQIESTPKGWAISISDNPVA